jgi:hypothetical protein
MNADREHSQTVCVRWLLTLFVLDSFNLHFAPYPTWVTLSVLKQYTGAMRGFTRTQSHVSHFGCVRRSVRGGDIYRTLDVEILDLVALAHLLASYSQIHRVEIEITISRRLDCSSRGQRF